MIASPLIAEVDSDYPNQYEEEQVSLLYSAIEEI